MTTIDYAALRDEARVRTQVAAGVLLLDAEKPGWADLIDLDRLDMRLSDRCVLGQLYDGVDGYRLGYYAAIDAFWPKGRAYAQDRAAAHGFTVPEPDGEWTEAESVAIGRVFDALEAEWRARIAARRTPSYEG